MQRTTSFQIVCACCGNKNKDHLDYFKFTERTYFRTKCCGCLVCYTCNNSKGTCMVCSKETSGEEVDKEQGGNWKACFKMLQVVNDCLKMEYMIPFLRAHNFQLMEIWSTFFIHDIKGMYQKFVEDLTSKKCCSTRSIQLQTED